MIDFEKLTDEELEDLAFEANAALMDRAMKRTENFAHKFNNLLAEAQVHGVSINGISKFEAIGPNEIKIRL